MAQYKPTYGLATHWRVLFLAVMGAIAGTLLDSLHVHTGTAGYRNVPILPLLRVAWYVPPEFAAAGVVVGMLRPELDEELQRERTSLPTWQIVAGMFFFIGMWASTGVLGSRGLSNVTITAILAPLGALGWYVFDGTKQGVIAATITATIGVLVESVLTYTGTYYYTRPDFIGVPMWLPVLYVTACGAVGNVGRLLKYAWDLPESPSEEPKTPAAETA